MIEVLKKYSYIVCVVLIILLGFGLRLYLYLSAPSFWFDESALGYNVLTLSYKKLFGILHLQQVAPPLFLVSTKFLTTIFYSSDKILRLIPFIIGNICIFSFFIILKNVFESKIAILWGLLLFSLNTQLIWYSVEFKPYILEVFSMCFLFCLFKNINWNWSFRRFILLGLSLSVIPWFAFVSSVIILAGEIIIFSKNNLKKWLMLFIPTIVSLLLLIFYFLKIKSFYYNFMEDFFIYNFLHLKIIFIQLFFCICDLFSMKYAILPAILFIAGVMYCIVNNRKYNYLNKYFVFVSLVFIILSFIKIYPFFDRFILFLSPLFLIFMLSVLEIKNNYLKVLISLFLTIFLLFPTILNTKKLLKNTNIKGDYAKELIQDLNNHIKKDDIIYVDTLSTPDFLYYSNYYKFKNRIYLNVDIIKEKILYKPDNNKRFKDERLNSENIWIYAPWAKNNYSDCKYDYRKVYYPKSQILYIGGN